MENFFQIDCNMSAMVEFEDEKTFRDRGSGFVVKWECLF